MIAEYFQDHEKSMHTFCWKNVSRFHQDQANISVKLRCLHPVACIMIEQVQGFLLKQSCVRRKSVNLKYLCTALLQMASHWKSGGAFQYS
jgi:hypothetical protein